MAVCCQNLTLGALSSRSALSVLVGALFKKFGLFLNTPRIYYYIHTYSKYCYVFQCIFIIPREPKICALLKVPKLLKLQLNNINNNNKLFVTIAKCKFKTP